ncbi:MAG: molybdate ABC transporter substrate-binding protein [Beijerinckiaceae bacterium]
MKFLTIISAGAAQSLLRALSPRFEASHGSRIESQFATAGGVAAKLEAGEAADLAIMPLALMQKIGATGHVALSSITSLGAVGTALAVRRGDIVPDVGDADSLRAALLAAARIYAPEYRQATAGIHFKRVLESLGIWDAVEPRLKHFPNGETTMKELASTAGARCIGCAQATEIMSEPGVVVAGNLPGEFKLETIYAAGVTRQVKDAALAGEFIELITGEATRAMRERTGFA